MASTNFTTHYSIPLPLGTDLTTPMDYNEAAEAVDTALFGAVTDAGNASIAAGNAVNTANAAAEEVDTLGTDLTQEKAKIVALQTRVTNAENEIDDVRADASDMITAYNEPTATATHTYAIGDFFIYNNTLYKATAAIAIGATIVPDTNCETTNVSTELIEVKSALNYRVLASVQGDGVKYHADIIRELMSAVGENIIGSTLVFDQTGGEVCYNVTGYNKDTGACVFTKHNASSAEATIDQINVTDSTYEFRRWTLNTGGNTYSTIADTTVSATSVFKIVK